MLGNRAHKSLQPHSNLEVRKGLKEAQYVAYVHSTAHPHPPRTRGAISASLEGSPLRPSTAPRVSTSLEGSEPTLGGEDRLRLARGHPSTERTNDPSAHPPAVASIFFPFYSLSSPCGWFFFFYFVLFLIS